MTPYVSRKMTPDQYRTEEYPYLSADVKALLRKLRVGVTEISRVIGVIDPNNFRNALRGSTRRFTKEEYFVILKACNEILENREMVEDLI